MGAQEALQAGKPFVFEMKDELAEVYPSAKMWRESFPRLEQKQFALALLREPLVARLYLGVSMLDRRTVEALIANSSLYYFTGRTADLLAIYGTAFAVEGTRASVPGGVAAGPVWKEMVGVGPERAGAFYQALLDQKTTTLAAYFFALSQLDAGHQAFFTANVARMKRFYGVYATLPEAQGSAPANVAKDSPFRALLRSVPIDGKGHVTFPGSVAVWARGGGGGGEDEILLRMVETRVRSRDGGLTALDGFLAVAHIDAHRKARLDEASARLLADRYAECGGAYAYFAELTGVDAAGFRSFFAMVDGAARLPVLQANLTMGQMHSLVEWVVLMRRRQVVDDAEAALLFGAICERLTGAKDEGGRTVAAIDLAEAVLAKCPGAGGWDDRLRGCLLGGSAERPDRRGRDFQIVLDEQKAPSLDAVRGIVAGARGSGTGLGALAGGLPSVLPGKDTVMSAREKDALALFDPARVQRVAAASNGESGRAGVFEGDGAAGDAGAGCAGVCIFLPERRPGDVGGCSAAAEACLCRLCSSGGGTACGAGGGVHLGERGAGESSAGWIRDVWAGFRVRGCFGVEAGRRGWAGGGGGAGGCDSRGDVGASTGGGPAPGDAAGAGGAGVDRGRGGGCGDV